MVPDAPYARPATNRTRIERKKVFRIMRMILSGLPSDNGSQDNSSCERVGTHLDLVDLRSRRGPSFVMEYGARARCCPESVTFPASAWVIDTSIDVLAEETHRIGNVDVHELTVDERQESLAAVRFCDRHVRSKPERIVSIHPNVVSMVSAARLRDVLELRPGEWI